jgi:parvulin-like peptidyl-prolyl isomerase
MTKKELSRWEREQRQQRMATLFVIATIALVAGVILFGFYRESLARPNELVAKVGSTGITLDTFAKDMSWRVRNLDNQINSLQAQIQQYQLLAANNDQTAAFLVQLGQQQIQQLQQERLTLRTGTQILEDLIDDEIIRQEARRRGMTVTSADVEARIASDFSSPPPSPTPAPTITGTEGMTTTVPSPTPSPTPAGPTPTRVPSADWQNNYRSILTQLKISDADFRRLAVEPRLYRERLLEAFAAEVPASAEQVHARHILVNSESDAKDVLAYINEVGLDKVDWNELASKRSVDTATSSNGGDLGWFPRGVMAPEVEQVAFSLEPGQISQPVSTTFGYHIIQVLEKDPNRPLDDNQREQLRNARFSTWLQERRQQPDVQRFFDSDKLAWADKAAFPEDYRRTTGR